MKRKLCVLIISVLLLMLTFSGCAQTQQLKTSELGIFDFKNYENEEVFDIREVTQSSALARKCVTYKFTYLSDDFEIVGYISIPVSAIKLQKPQKCVMFNRGGNAQMGGLEDSTTANISAKCDRIVIASQYRGSDGSEGFDEFGGSDVNDVIKLIDLCEKHFTFIDMDDFCVAGVSRGGMMTYMAARQDSRIKRIISISGVSDLFMEYEERDDMKEMLPEYIGCTPQENKSEYEKRSAIYWCDEIKIPVLIIHSTDDERVSYEQAEQLYEKMKGTTDCTLVTHKDDLHGIHKKDFKTINKWLNND